MKKVREGGREEGKQWEKAPERVKVYKPIKG